MPRAARSTSSQRPCRAARRRFCWLHALDITTGADKVPPVSLQASAGSGAGFHVDAPTSEQRPGLFLVNGVVYVGLGSSGDSFPWVGWLLGYNATTLAQVSVFCTSGAGALGAGVWGSGEAPAVDASGNIFLSTGNGYFSSGSNAWADTFLKLSTAGGLSVLDYFAPFNVAALGLADLDVAAAGITLLPDTVGSAAHPHLLVGSGKDGEIYLIDRDNMGHFNGSYNTPNSNVVQWIPGQIGTVPVNPTAMPMPYAGNSFTTPAYWQNHVYFCGAKDVCKAFTLANGLLSTTPTSQAPSSFGYPGSQPVISAANSSATSAVLWTIERDSVNNASTLHAYDATNLANEVYNSNQASGSRDRGGPPIKFAVPTVANGKVFVGRTVRTGRLRHARQQRRAPRRAGVHPRRRQLQRTAGGHDHRRGRGHRPLHARWQPADLGLAHLREPDPGDRGGHRAGDRREGRGTDQPRGECQLHDRAAPAPDRVRAGQLRHAADRADRRQRALHRDAVRR